MFPVYTLLTETYVMPSISVCMSAHLFILNRQPHVLYLIKRKCVLYDTSAVIDMSFSALMISINHAYHLLRSVNICIDTVNFKIYEDKTFNNNTCKNVTCYSYTYTLIIRKLMFLL